MFKKMFYTIYQFDSKIKINTYPEYSSMLLIMMLQIFNFGTVFPIFIYMFNINLNLQIIKYVYFSVFIVTNIINYVCILKNKEKILNKYDNESKKSKIKGIIVLLLYFTLTLVAFALTIEFIVEPNSSLFYKF
jgi:hypothetical protein